MENIQSLIDKEEFFFIGKKTTVCLLTLKNGFELVASSACIKEESFNEDVGKIISRELALQKLYEYLTVKAAMENKECKK